MSTDTSNAHDDAFRKGHSDFCRAHSARLSTSISSEAFQPPDGFVDPYRTGWDQAAQDLAERARLRARFSNTTGAIVLGLVLSAAGSGLLLFALTAEGELTYLALCVLTPGVGLLGLGLYNAVFRKHPED